MKKIIGFFLIFTLSVICGICAYADEPASLYITVPQGQVNVGDTVTVRLDITAVKPIGKVTASLSYDVSVLTFVSGDGATGGNGIINVDQLNGLNDGASISLSFTAASQGQANVAVSSCKIYDAFDQPFELGEKSASIQVANAEQTTSPTQTETQTQTTTKATDANGVPTQGVLVDLQIDNGTLIPPFMYSIHEYSVTVPYEVEKVEIEGKTASRQDNIWYTGNPDCVVGRNVRTITVTDIYGNETVYTINITRLDKDEKETTTTAASDPAQSTVSNSPSAKQADSSKKDSDIKDTLVPALYIVLIVLVVALFIVILWIKNNASKKGSEKERSDKKTQKQRSKIKVSGSADKKKKK